MNKPADIQYEIYLKDFIAEKSYITEKEEAVLYALALLKTDGTTPADAQFPPMNMIHITPYRNGYEVIGFYDHDKTRTPFTLYVEKKTTSWAEFDPDEIPRRKKSIFRLFF